jgi:hypothetical protein
MKYDLRPISLLMLLAAILFPATTLNAGTLTVNSTANIFGAGLSVPPGTASPGSPGNGILPPSFTFASGGGQVLTFTSVTGTVSFNGATNCPPDGCTSGTAGVPGVDFNAQGGISGIMDDPGDFFFLEGVFLTNSPGSVAPATLDFTGNENFASLSPLIGQTFFVGNGLTGSAQTQIFNVPANATTLYLGFADASGFVGNPGSYNDNTGSLAATFTIGQSSPSPEPESFLLAATALLIVGLRAIGGRLVTVGVRPEL